MATSVRAVELILAAAASVVGFVLVARGADQWLIAVMIALGVGVAAVAGVVLQLGTAPL